MKTKSFIIRWSEGRMLLVIAVAALLSGVTVARAATPVACGDILSAPGEYVLTGNTLGCAGPGGGGAIRITASGVHLNMAGFTLGGPGGFPPPGQGIVVAAPNGCNTGAPGPTDVHINGGTIKGYHAGILLCFASGNHISGMTLTENRYGVIALSSHDNQFSGNTVSGNQSLGFGVIRSSTGNKFTANTCNGNALEAFSGCYSLEDSTDNTVTSNEMVGNGKFGVQISCTTMDGCGGGNTIRGNTIVGTTLFGDPRPGITVLFSNGNRIQGNTSGSNRFGIFLFQSAGNTVQSNTVLSNTLFDLWSDLGCDVNTWKSNTFGTRSPACIQ